MLLSGAGPGSFPASLTLQDPTFPVGRGIAHACSSPRCKGTTAQSACTGNVAICRVRHTPPIQPKHPSGHTHAVPCCRPLRVEHAALRRRRWPPLPPQSARHCWPLRATSPTGPRWRRRGDLRAGSPAPRTPAPPSACGAASPATCLAPPTARTSPRCERPGEPGCSACRRALCRPRA